METQIVKEESEINLVQDERVGKKIWKVGTLTYTTGGLVLLFFWLLGGDFAWAIRERSMHDVFKLLLKNFGSSDFLNGILVSSVPAALAMIFSPYFCFQSDRHRGKWGRRIPYLVWTTPIATFGLFGIAFAPMLGTFCYHAFNLGSSNGNVLLFLGLFWVLFEGGVSVSWPLFTGLVNDVVPQQVIGRFYGLFRKVSLWCGILFNLYALGLAEHHSFPMLILVTLVFGVGFLLMCWRVKEGEYPPPPSLKGRSGMGAFTDGTKMYVSEAFTHKYYLLIYAAKTMCFLTMVPTGVYNFFYASQLKVNLNQLGNIQGLALFMSFLCAYPLGAMADRFHPLRVTMLSMMLVFLISITGGFLIESRLGEGLKVDWVVPLFGKHVLLEGKQVLFGLFIFLLNFASGVFWTGSASLCSRLFPRDHYATLSSGLELVRHAAMIPIAPLIGFYLDHTGRHYNHVFIIVAGMALTSFILMALVEFEWRKLGGNNNYIPPSVHSD